MTFSKEKDKDLLLIHGLIAGLLISLMTVSLSISDDFKIGLIKFLIYLPLTAVLISHARLLKPIVQDQTYFPKLLSGGLLISSMAGIFLMATTLILFGINPEFAPMKFNLMPANWLDATTISVMQLFETTALGFTINLIVFQYYKMGPRTLNA
jgi:hypothetical protein